MKMKMKLKMKLKMKWMLMGEFAERQDVHRTGCSLFCYGEEAALNQALLKRVLLAYARYNKAVGYCQGFNVLAALLLEVMNRSQTETLKVNCTFHSVRLSS